MYVTLVFRVKGSRLVKPSLCLALLCPAFLVGVVRVAEYRNHWSDVLAGFLTGAAIATFLVSPLPATLCMEDLPFRPLTQEAELLSDAERSRCCMAWGGQVSFTLVLTACLFSSVKWVHTTKSKI